MESEAALCVVALSLEMEGSVDSNIERHTYFVEKENLCFSSLIRFLFLLVFFLSISDILYLFRASLFFKVSQENEISYFNP